MGKPIMLQKVGFFVSWLGQASYDFKNLEDDVIPCYGVLIGKWFENFCGVVSSVWRKL